MAMKTRRPGDPMAAAEAMFKKTAKPVAATPPRTGALPVGKELVSIRIDRDVLEAFQAEGAGWQERVNAALRQAAGLGDGTDTGRRPEDLDASNDD